MLDPELDHMCTFPFAVQGNILTGSRDQVGYEWCWGPAQCSPRTLYNSSVSRVVMRPAGGETTQLCHFHSYQLSDAVPGGVRWGGELCQALGDSGSLGAVLSHVMEREDGTPSLSSTFKTRNFFPPWHVAQRRCHLTSESKQSHKQNPGKAWEISSWGTGAIPEDKGLQR